MKPSLRPHLSIPLAHLRKIPQALLALVLIAGLLGSSFGSSLAGSSPLILVNKSGYLPYASKLATVVDDSLYPRNWALYNNSDQVVLTGRTTVLGDDTLSGDHLHEIDFSEYVTPGSGYYLKILTNTSDPFDITDTLYEDLKTDAAAYFYLNRSGLELTSTYTGADLARAAGHLSDDDVTCWEGTDYDGTYWDGCDYSLDVASGWYDAGDYGKYVVNGGLSAWLLLNAYELNPTAFADGSLSIPENANGVPDILDEARWEVEFLLSMQVPDGKDLAGMAHHKVHTLPWDSFPQLPPTSMDNDNDNSDPNAGRYLYASSTAATLNLAAVGAQCTRIWQAIDPTFSAQCLTAAEKAWTAAVAHPDSYFGNNPGSGGGNYDDTNVSDEFYWAAAELFITTGNQTYKDYLTASVHFLDSGEFYWGFTAPLGTISLALVDNDLTSTQINDARLHIQYQADALLNKQAEQGYRIPLYYDPGWGSNGILLDNLVNLSLAYEFSGNAMYLFGVEECMDYLLGRNPLDISYISGYGEDSMQHPHHRFWANDTTNGWPAPPEGVVAGGPNKDANDPAAVAANLSTQPILKRYLDDRDSYSTNEVAINWNAPLVWVSAFLDAQASTDPRPAAPTLVAPASGITTTYTTLNYRWNAVNSADTYQFQISTEADFATILADRQTTATQYAYGPVPYEDTYYWRVRASADGLWGNWSGVRSLLVTHDKYEPNDNLASAAGPYDLVNNYQKYIEAFVGSNSDEDWFAFTIEAGQSIRFWVNMQYRVKSYDGADLMIVMYKPDGTFLAMNKDAAAYNDPALKRTFTESGTYYLKVVLQDPALIGRTDTENTYQLMAQWLDAPTLVSPADGVTTGSARPNLDWDPVDYALQYTVQVSSSPTFLPAALRVSQLVRGSTNTNLVLSTALPSGTYYWRVQARNLRNLSEWSEVWGFQVP